MTKKEYLESVLKSNIDDSKVGKVESLYGRKMPDIIRRIVSNNDEAEFFDDGIRFLSLNEILDAETDLHINFSALGMIPIADCGENDFIVYHFKDHTWSKFNIIDETVFKKKADLLELLK